MFTLLSYPLSVISANRMAGSGVMKEAGENLPREFLSLYERGELKRGLFRGLGSTLAYALFWSQIAVPSEVSYQPLLKCVLGTTLLNSLAVMQTRRQILCSETLQNPLSYGKQLAGPSAIMSAATLGLAPHLLRNLCMCVAFAPQDMGSKNEGLTALYALGACLLSHPWEVARVMIVHNGGGKTTSTLSALFEAEGVAGIYRGFIPRTLHLVPALIALNHAQAYQYQWFGKAQEGFSSFATAA